MHDMTPKQAAEYLKKCFTKAYKVSFVNEMRERHGDDYVKQMEVHYRGERK